MDNTVGTTTATTFRNIPTIRQSAVAREPVMKGSDADPQEPGMDYRSVAMANLERTNARLGGLLVGLTI